MRGEALGISAIRLSFTLETPEETGKILEDFKAAYRGGAVLHQYEFTKGHFKEEPNRAYD